MNHPLWTGRTIDRVSIASASFLLAVGAAALVASASASAASLPVVSADLKLQSLSVSSTTSGRSVVSLSQVVVQNDNDDDARNVQIIVTLAPTTHVLATSPNAVLGPSYPDPSAPWQTTGNVVFSLPKIGVGKTASVWLQTEMLATEVTPTTSVGAFVFGSLPDPIGANNFSSAPILGH